MQTMSKKRNRLQQPLEFLRLEVEHADGTEHCCPNGMVGCAIWAATGEAPEFNQAGLMPWTKLFNPLALRPKPGVASVLSGEDAVVYRADDVEIAMSPQELYRFICHDLRPDEFRALMDRFGSFHEIHDDYYDPRSGLALQPIRIERPEPQPSMKP
jgi:hypothetical protein